MNARQRIGVLILTSILLGCCNRVIVKQESNELIGRWIADGTQIISAEKEDIDELDPYYLEFYEDNSFKLTMGEEIVQGTYQINEDSIYLNSDMTVMCDLNNEELSYNMYATKFVKE